VLLIICRLVWTTVAIVNNDFDADRKDVIHYTQKTTQTKKYQFLVKRFSPNSRLLIRFVADLLYNKLYNKSTANRISGVCALHLIVRTTTTFSSEFRTLSAAANHSE